MKRKTWMRSLIVSAAVLITGIFGGCGRADRNSLAAAQSSSQTVQEDREIHIADTQAPTGLDPAQSWDGWYTVRWGITETLFRLDDQLKPQPYLAEKGEQKDAQTWVITLRSDVKFQNGKTLTAESVKKCWERTQGINVRFRELLYIESMEADGQILTIRTSKRVPALLNSLCDPLCSVIDTDAGTDIASMPVGTGPFIPVEYTVKNRCIVRANPDYWGGTVRAKGAVIQIIGDTNTLAMAQQNKESDVSVSMPGSSLSLFQNSDEFYADGVAGSRGQILYFNFQNEFLKEAVIRKAIALVIDKEQYARVLNDGASVPAQGIYPDFMEYGSGGQDNGYDPKKAQQLLEEAGYSDTDGDGIRERNGKDIELRLITYHTKAELPLYANEIAAAAKKIGISVKTEVYDSIAPYQKSGDFDMLLLSMTMCPTGDTQYFADISLKSNGSGNYGGYANPAVDQLIEELDTETDQTKRSSLAGEIQKKVTEDAGIVVIGHAKYYYVMNRALKGLKTNPSEYYLLNREMYIEQS